MYDLIENNAIIRSVDERKQDTVYIPSIDDHVDFAAAAAHGWHKRTRQAASPTDTQKVTGWTLQVVNGKPVEVPAIVEKGQAELDAELQAWRDNATLPAHTAMSLLREAGIKSAMQSAINAISDPATKARAQDGFDRAPYFNWSDPLVQAVWSQAGKTPEELDALFRSGGA